MTPAATPHAPRGFLPPPARYAIALIALTLACAPACWPPLAAQDVPDVVVERAVRDSAPTYDQLARSVLTLKVQVEGLRARIGQRPGADGGWRPAAWADSLNAIRSGLVALGSSTGRLEGMYRAARHSPGLRVATELSRLVERARYPVDSLTQAASPASARTAATHLAAGIEALLQKIAEGETCCVPARDP